MTGTFLIGSSLTWADPYLQNPNHPATHPASHPPTHPATRGLTYLNWFKSYWGLVSQLSLIWAWSKPMRRSMQDFWPYPNKDQDDRPQWGTSSILQSPISGFKGHRSSLRLQNQDRKPKFGTWVYKRPMTLPKSRSRCQTPFRNLQHPSKPPMRT